MITWCLEIRTIPLSQTLHSATNIIIGTHVERRTIDSTVVVLNFYEQELIWKVQTSTTIICHIKFCIAFIKHGVHWSDDQDESCILYFSVLEYS